MGIFSFVSEIFKPAAKLVDDLHTSAEEKLEMKAKLTTIQNEMSSKILTYETKLMEAQSSIVKAEISGKSWLQRNWRPLLMLTIMLIIFNNYVLFPYLSMFTAKAIILELPSGLWTLLTTGVGGYVIGRSAEKIVPNLTQVVTNRKNNAVG